MKFTHTNNALYLSSLCGQWAIRDDRTLEINGGGLRFEPVVFHWPYNTLDWEHVQNRRDLGRSVCLMAEPDGSVGLYRLDCEGDTLYAWCFDATSPSGVRTEKILDEGVKRGQGWNVIAVIIPNRLDRERLHLNGDASHAPLSGSPLPALCEIEWEGLADGPDVGEWTPCTEGGFDAGKITYSIAIDALRAALNTTMAHALEIVDTACEDEPSGLGEYYTVTGHRFIQLRPHEWIPVPCPEGIATWDWADVRLELDGFPLIPSTNPLATLPSEKIAALEAGLDALRTLRLSGVDWKRLADR